MGQTKNSLKKRLKDHLRKNSHCTLLSRAMHKYGLDSFEVCELAKAESRKQLLELEKHFIKSLGTMHPKGYNLTSGGESPRFSKESRVKMSFAKKGKKLPDEVNRKIRQAQSGANHPMFMTLIAF